MNVSVFGLGYVGCVTAACLASQGHRVIGVDINNDKVETINLGCSPMIEHGLDGLIKEVIRKGNLRATTDPYEAVIHADVMLICVGTPSDSNGNLNFKFIDRVCMDIGQSLCKDFGYKVIAIRSTLLPGTISQRVVPLLMEASGNKVEANFAVASNPEFLREGSAIEDFTNPPFTIIGTIDEQAGVILETLYQEIPAPIFRTDPDTACMVKYASNAFHSLKVVFTNEIGQLSKTVGVDGTEVMDIFCKDTCLNISSKYLKPGFAFGGSCLPKDLRAMLYLARHNDLHLPMLESILPSNRLHIENVVDFILRDPTRKDVGVIGLTFKAGTDDLRESPMVQLVETINGKGLRVKIYDNNISLSKLIGGNKAFIENALPHISSMICDSLEEVVQTSDVIVVGHDLFDGVQQFTGMLKPDQLVIDLVKIASTESSPASFEGICW